MLVLNPSNLTVKFHIFTLIKPLNSLSCKGVLILVPGPDSLEHAADEHDLLRVGDRRVRGPRGLLGRHRPRLGQGTGGTALHSDRVHTHHHR